MTDELCACGEPLHYADQDTRAIIDELVRRHGQTVLVTVPFGGGRSGWRVPRHYLALHQVSAVMVPVLADRYGWERVP